MASPFGDSWFHALLCSCICFLLQNGYNTAHAFDLYESPETSPQHNSGLPLNTNYENEQQARRQQNLVPQKREHIQYRNQGDENGFTNAGKDVAQRQPDPGQQFSEAPPTPAHQYEISSGYHHPLGLLLKQHAPDSMKGVSFPTMNHFRRFIESMKVSFLTPGSDASIHFQTAREAMKKLNEESSMGYRSNFAQEGTDRSDNSPAEVGSESGASYYMPKEQLSVPNPGGFPASPTSLRGFDNPEFSLGSAPYPHQSAAKGYVSSNLANGGHPGEKDDLLERASENPHVQGTGNRPRGQTHFPAGSSYGKDSSHKGLAAASPNNPSSSQPQDFNYYPSKIPNRSPSKAKFTTMDSSLEKRTPPVDFNHRKDFQRVTQSDDVPQQRPPSMKYRDESLQTPSNRIYAPKNVHKQRGPPPMTVRSYQPTKDTESKDLSYTPAIYQPVNNSYLSLSSDKFIPQKTHEGFRTGDERGPQQQPNKSNFFKVRPPSSTLGSSRPISYSRYQKTNPTHIVLTAPDKMGRTSDAYSQNRATITQTQTDDAVTRPQGMTARNSKRQFSRPQRRSVLQNDGYRRTNRFDLQQTSIQPLKATTNPVSLKRPTRNLVYWPSEPNGCVYWTNEDNTNGPAPKTSVSSLNALVKSKNRSGRATAHRSKLCYTPHQQAQKQSSVDQWKLALKQQNYKNKAY